MELIPKSLFIADHVSLSFDILLKNYGSQENPRTPKRHCFPFFPIMKEYMAILDSHSEVLGTESQDLRIKIRLNSNKSVIA